MLKASTFLAAILTVFVHSFSAFGQVGISNPHLRDLPIVISWDDQGIRITSKTQGARTANLINIRPSQFLEQIGNDLVQVSIGAEETPVIIDVSDFFKATAATLADNNGYYPNMRSQIDIYMPKLVLADYNEPNSFVIDLINFSDKTNNSHQSFLIKGLDVFYVVTDNCAELSGVQNRVTIDVKKCGVQHLMLKGGLLALDDVEKRIPDLCRKYNDRYFSQDEPDAFVCLEECREEDPNAMKNLRHSRDLVTKYNITDFEDEPISFLGNLLLTKKGVGLNLKMEVEEVAGAKGRKKERGRAYEAYDEFRFFPWYEFINLSFSKYLDDKRLMIEDPYNNSYVFNSDVYFSNVELIQFFNELRALISSQLN
ncbi:hypothetical protein [Flavilitoribacter nigricans]|uniref:Uncharacterized protein n=1 Tax=Flavilitoribacter nigricans (strain ATCC 23147 / DSM 23189 / NBRC 102662 / NCIMB 1420 / SS-2) TaxID=1122177 RepID=A0A2D0NEI0_FLAN2|nr:hypothetical protein [Flavilitoribacter nigricans]PHN06911.1 hypothetical protein CRP01_08830 [Flavilitoribacter nigricans DSM 23189 = NBRC 102662]